LFGVGAPFRDLSIAAAGEKRKNALVEAGGKLTTGGWIAAQQTVEWAKTHKKAGRILAV
jgi:hypothetical protein